MKAIKVGSAYQVATLAILMAMQLLLGSFLSIQFLTAKITFSFIVTAFLARLYPPKVTAGVTALSYLIGMLLFPKFAFFFGFVITAALTGYTFGICFYQKTITWRRIAIAAFVINFGWNLFLNSTWLHMMYGIAWSGLFATRVPQEIVYFGIYVVLIKMCFTAIPIERLQRSRLD